MLTEPTLNLSVPGDKSPLLGPNCFSVKGQIPQVISHMAFSISVNHPGLQGSLNVRSHFWRPVS